ncbi:MAG TPA: orotidine-5'-phosphate decarboxylase [Gemmatimonadaceae bacterium]|nr:orotidine-5'-phosphate decarboxylase [Gemmatimonadaceae bacterium]
MSPHARPAGTRTKIASKTPAESRGARPTAIVALDFPGADGALTMVDRLGDACNFYKVGSELFTSAGPQIVQTLRALGKDVFLDLKLHDIPNTVRGGARSAASIGAKLLSVHASGGRAMIEAAVEGAGDRCGVLGVTILTSLDAASLRSAWGRKTLEVYGEVLRLAGDCAAAGAHGVVCSGLEAKKIGAKYGDKLKLLIPGIRAAGGKIDDQKRTVTAHEAGKAGASYIVLGRIVTQAKNPASELRSIIASI